jgi:transcriptional regulator of acetoin/glycerol metabolism
LILTLVLVAKQAFATQAHSAPKGLYAHQLGHIFFIVPMGVLIYWLRARQLVQMVGWRYIQHAALFFILWNLDAFCVHLLEEYKGNVSQVARQCGPERHALQQIMRRYQIKANDYR